MAETRLVVQHREQLWSLLVEAAQIEHMIMCQYLYASFSIRTEPDEGLTAEQTDARPEGMGAAVRTRGHAVSAMFGNRHAGRCSRSGQLSSHNRRGDLGTARWARPARAAARLRLLVTDPAG
jgi:hypothetical protein